MIGTGVDPLARLVTLFQVVESDADDAGDELEFGVILAVLVLAHIGGDGLGALIGDVALVVNFEAQRLWESLLQAGFRLVRGIGFTFNDKTQDTVFPTHGLKSPDFLVDPN